MTIQERLTLLQQETNRWANGGWITKEEILEEAKKLNCKSFRKCLVCEKKLDQYCKYRECLSCRREVAIKN